MEGGVGSLRWLQKKDVWKLKKRKVKRFIYQTKMEVNKQFEKKMNQDVNRNRKSF